MPLAHKQHLFFEISGRHNHDEIVVKITYYIVFIDNNIYLLEQIELYFLTEGDHLNPL